MTYDGTEVGRFLAADLERPVALLELPGVDLGAVSSVRIEGGDQALHVPDPLQRYPNRALAAFAWRDEPAVGWVDLRLGAVPESIDGPPPVTVFGPRSVRLGSGRSPEGVRPEPPPISIEIPGREPVAVTQADADALPKRSAAEALGQGQGGQASASTFLGDLVGLAIPPEDVTSILVHASGAEPLELTRDDLVLPATRAALLQVNRRGSWRLKVWGPGSPKPTVVDDRRGVTRIEVRTGP